MAPLLVMERVAPKRIDIIPENTWMDYKTLRFQVKQQGTLHDVPNCCWHIRLNDGKQVFYATDTGSLEGIEAKGYDLYLIEANRDREELDQTIREKRDRGEYAYEYRVIGTHLFREQAEEFLANNMGERSRYLFLHQHKTKEGTD